ncbi:hypothetical protein SUGI_0935150 [Cryptomeria japonica]|uniref:uncharacterized protein LOC131077840 n=1 Tax=Cryptomeria japonica TaxID=3369 RepID=UPI0024147F4A|nr:uncharacterized protein LOC131077840 [Cryptomeria japonica]GLJ44536.1 hypothetical protein SUGI_0935150 [Cryptomeria japonica]
MESEKKQRVSQNRDHYAKGRSEAIFSDDIREIQTIDVSEEIEKDINFLKDLAIICRFIGPRTDRKSIERWIEETWKTSQITKFMPKGFFIVVFASEEERQKILEGGLWTMNNKPLYIQKWYRNFNPLKMEPYEKPIWIRLNNLPMEYWSKEGLEKIGRSMGTLMEIDAEITTGNSYLYARMKLVAVRRIPQLIKLRSHDMEWLQAIEIEEEKYFCSICGRRNHDLDKCRNNKNEKKVWRVKQAAGNKKSEELLQITVREQVNENLDKKQSGVSQEAEGNNKKDLEEKACNLESNCQSDIGLEEDEISEEDEDKDELEITDIRNIGQSMVIPIEKGIRGKGQKSNKMKREEEVAEKGFLSVSEFLNRKSTKGVNSSLGKQ